MLLLFDNGAKGYLALPSAGTTRECDDRNAAGTFMEYISCYNWLLLVILCTRVATGFGLGLIPTLFLDYKCISTVLGPC